MSSKTRALGATILFCAAGFWAVLFHNVPWEYVYPHILFYTVLTINTFFSIGFFSSFTPESTFQSGIDFALAAAYIGLALMIGIPLPFSYFALLIFILAPLKYAALSGKTPYNATLRRKILIDLSGTLLCAVVLALTLLQMAWEAGWILAILFALANIYLLLIRPMYRHVE